MKRFLLFALTAGLLSPIAAEAFWKYGSLYEAIQACEKWRDAGGKYKRAYQPMQASFVKIRECWNEEKTNQILGGSDISKSKGASYKNGDLPEKNIKVIKRFKY